MNLHRAGTKVGGTFRANSELLKSSDVIQKFLSTMVTRLEMNDLTTVSFDVADELKKRGQKIEADEGGITAITVLSTSHIAIHTWPEENATDIENYDLSFSLEKLQVSAYSAA
mgnify:CR=1 FL=1